MQVLKHSDVNFCIKKTKQISNSGLLRLAKKIDPVRKLYAKIKNVMHVTAKRKDPRPMKLDKNFARPTCMVFKGPIVSP